MTTAEGYITQVIDALPTSMRERDQIAVELRGLIAERLSHGQPLDEVLRQLGDPLTLAESYLSAVPLISATFWPRVAAKLVDLLLICVPMLTIACVIVFSVPADVAPIVLLFALFGSSILAACYLVFAEANWGYTIGKRMMDLRVVRESGARISTGQAVVRQLPLLFQFFWVDALFALFTEKHQRAFELLSKTRVVRGKG